MGKIARRVVYVAGKRGHVSPGTAEKETLRRRVGGVGEANGEKLRSREGTRGVPFFSRRN